MARAVRRTPVVLAALVGVSVLLHWLAARHFTGLWIMPDESIYGTRAEQLWEGTRSIVSGGGAGYSVLYPVVAGLPLAIGRLTTGYAWLKPAQALVMSLTAIPVYLYGQRLMRPGYALVAAALALASPLLLYSGLLMTEVLIYPLGACALVTIALAVETASLRDQALAFLFIAAAVLTRVQSVVLVAVFTAAVLLDALFRRDRGRLRAFWPVWIAIAAAVVVLLASPSAFGAYSGTVRGSYPLRSAAGLAFDHLAYIVLETGIVPAVALVLLVAEAVRRRHVDPAERALLIVAATSLVLVVLQVGLFASRFAPHLLGRDLALLPPILFLVFALWLDRGAPRPRVVVTPVILAVFLLLALAPWHRLAAADALPDSFGLAILNDIGANWAATAVAVTAVVVLTVVAATPGRGLLVLPLLVLTLLVTSAAVASHDIANRVNYDQRNLVGSPRDWIHRATSAPVALLYDGEAYWNGVWQIAFWNPNVRSFVSLAPTPVPGPLRQRVVEVDASGALPIHERYVVASDPHTFIGTPVARIDQTGVTQAGMTLWRLDGPPRVSTVERGILPNGDIIGGPGVITAYDCGGGQLELTLIPKETRVVTIKLNGHVVQRANIGGLPYWNGTVYAPRSRKPIACTFEIDGQGLLGTTKVDFVR